MINAAQMRAARGLMGWSQTKLGETSGLALSTIKRMESDRGPMRSSAENVVKVKQALENAGVIFIDRNEDGGPGVRLK